MLTRDEVLKIAKLARLDLTEPEIQFYQAQLGRVLEYIHELDSLPTPEESVVRHVPKDAVAFREDKPVLSPYAKAILDNAPESEAGLYVLPAVWEGE